MLRLAWSLFAASMLAGCGRGADAPESSASIVLTEVVVGPTKAGGKPWDPMGSSLGPEQVAELSRALGAPEPVPATLALLSGPSLSALSRPEVVGHATLFAAGRRAGQLRFRGQEDSFHASLTPMPEWSHIALGDNTRLLVRLSDDDLGEDDVIANFTLTAQDLRAAAAHGELYQVPLAERTQRAVLFAGINVIPE